MFFPANTVYPRDFKAISERFGSIDISSIPIGVYAPRWLIQDMYVNPEEAVQIHQGVQSRFSVGMHWWTFLNLTNELLLELAQRRKEVLTERKLSPDIFITLNPAKPWGSKRLQPWAIHVSCVVRLVFWELFF